VQEANDGNLKDDRSAVRMAMRAVQATGVMAAAAIIIFLLGAFLSFKAYPRE